LPLSRGLVYISNANPACSCVYICKFQFRPIHPPPLGDYHKLIGTESRREEPGTSFFLRTPQRLTVHPLMSREKEEANGLARRAGDRAAEIGVRRTPPLPLNYRRRQPLPFSRKAAEGTEVP
jgi:hypothetical protein